LRYGEDEGANDAGDEQYHHFNLCRKALCSGVMVFISLRIAHHILMRREKLS